MAIGTTAALVLGGAAIAGAGANVLGANAQGRAAGRAADSAASTAAQQTASNERIANQQIGLARDVYDTNTRAAHDLAGVGLQLGQNTTNAQLQQGANTTNAQLALTNPYRQQGLMASSALGQILGLPQMQGQLGAPQVTAAQVGGVDLPDYRGLPGQGGGGSGSAIGGATPAPVNRYQGYLDQNPDVAAEASRQTHFGSSFPRSYDANGNGRPDPAEFGRLHYDRYGRGEGRELPALNVAGPTSVTQAGGQAEPGVIQGTPGNDIIRGDGGTAGLAVGQGTQAGTVTQGGQSLADATAGYDPEEAFSNSLFSRAGDISFEQDQRQLSAEAAYGGSHLSGSHLLARETARERNTGNALGGFLGQLNGIANTGAQATAQQSNALGTFGANSANGIGGYNAGQQSVLGNLNNTRIGAASQFGASAGGALAQSGATQNNILGNLGAAQQNAHLQRGQATANAFNGVGSAIGSGVGLYAGSQGWFG